tara:strand:- start:21 stop:248 length:228 start_codon:yes stop_codon:yes gene_type:complete
LSYRPICSSRKNEAEKENDLTALARNKSLQQQVFATFVVCVESIKKLELGQWVGLRIGLLNRQRLDQEIDREFSN